MRIASNPFISRAIPLLPLFAIVVLLSIVPAPAPAAPVAGGRSLLAHGSDEEMWIVDVANVASSDGTSVGPQSTIIGRAPKHDRAAGAPPRGEWIIYTTVPARTVSLGNRSSQLIVLLDNGQWMLAWYRGSTLGRALPNGTIVAMAADEQAIWAVARVPGGLPAATRPATEAAAPPTTTPATTNPAATGTLILFTFQNEGWSPQVELPEQIAPDAAISMTLIDGRPVVAAAAGGRDVAIVRYGSEGAWNEWEIVQAPADVSVFKLLQLRKRLGIWVSTADGQDLLYQRAKNRNKWESTELALAEPLPLDVDRTVAVSGERVRLLFKRQGKLFEQRYELTGQPIDAPVEITRPDPQAVMTVAQWLNLLLTLLLMLVMFATVRQRKNLRSAMLESGKLSLAPLLPRFLAGFLDASPVLVTMVFIFAKYGPEPDEGATMLRWPLAIATAIYLLHTTLFELLTGRSIGKMLFGLRVVNLEGQRPAATAILLRNLLRIIDLFLFFPVMLILIFFSPLRQRAGDIAAGTLVVTNQPVEEKRDVQA